MPRSAEEDPGPSSTTPHLNHAHHLAAVKGWHLAPCLTEAQVSRMLKGRELIGADERVCGTTLIGSPRHSPLRLSNATSPGTGTSPKVVVLHVDTGAGGRK